MKLHRLFPALLLSAFTIPVCGQALPLSEVDLLLNVPFVNSQTLGFG
jgi:hypothetical protein